MSKLSKSTKTISKGKAKRVAFIPDVHYPLACNKAVEKVMGALEALQPSRIYQIGDLGDFEMFSRFPKDPRTQQGLDETLEMCEDFLLHLIS